MNIEKKSDSATQNFFIASEIEWGAISVPAAAVCSPVKLGELTLRGFWIPEGCRKLSERKIIWAETYWSTENFLSEDYQIQFIAIPERRCRMSPFSQDISQGEENPMWFTSNWTPGAIYKILFALEMPPLEKIANADLTLELRVISEEKILGVYRDSQKIEMNFPHTPKYKLDFPKSVLQVPAGRGWTAEQLEEITGGKWIVRPPKDWFLRSISFCRNLIQRQTPNSLCFVTTAKERFLHTIHFQQTARGIDEHIYLPKYAEIFSGAVVSHQVKNLPPDFPQLLVDDVIRAEFDLTFAARKLFQGKLIAVTGSNGKSTTVAMTRKILKDSGFNVGQTPGNYNISTGVTSIFTNLSFRTAYAVIEMSSMSLDTPWGSLCYGLKPHVAVITSIADSHLEMHGTVEGVAKVKCRILDGMEPGSYAILNRDMPYFEFIEQRAKENFLNVITFGSHPEAMIRMEKIQDGENFSFLGKKYQMTCPVPPDQIYDALAAAGVGFALKIPVETSLKRLKSYEMLRGRGTIFDAVYKEKKLRLIDGSFNATFLSIKTGLEYLNSVEENPKSRVAVLGDIAHLGDSSEKVHRQLAEVIFENKPDRIFLCGEFMKMLWEEIKDKCNCLWFESGQKLIPELDKLLQEGDCVFVKGSIPAKLNAVVKELKGI